MKKRSLKILYVTTKATTTLVALYIFNISFHYADDDYYIKILVYSAFVLFLIGIIHYFFMKLITEKDDNKS